MHKHLLTTLLSFICFHLVHAQTGVSGLVMDKTTRRPVEYVSVALYRPADSVAVAGTITDSVGVFRIAAIPPGQYQLRTFFIGYKARDIGPLTLRQGQTLRLDTLWLEGTSNQLSEVVITGQRSDLAVKADRQTYRAAQFQAAVGGTATDLLRNLPGISINAEGEVTQRGANGFLVLLNGKPVQANLGTLLNQLPANTIESIDVITTPSARYDPDGKAGIIAITTKAGADVGLSVLVNAQGGLPSLGAFGNARKPVRYGTDITLSYRTARWDWTFSTAYLRNDIAGRREGDVNTTRNNRFTTFPSVGERSFDRYTFTNRLAVSFTPNKKDVWSGGVYYGYRTEDRIADLIYNNRTIDRTTGQTLSQFSYFNTNLVRKRGQFFTANLDYTHTFTNKATLSAGALYEYDYLDGFTRNLNVHRTDTRDTLQYTLTTTARPISNARANVDATWPLAGGKLEAGYQYRYQEDDGDYRFLEQDGRGAPLRVIDAFTGRVRVSNQIHSLYSQYGRKTKRWEYTAGLRFESAERQVQIRPQEQLFPLSLRNLFPSANVVFRPTDAWQLRLGYSRRVQRTSNLALNPLPEREHSETLEQGDPALLPEFVDLSELGVSRTIGRSTLQATLYHQNIQNIVNRVNSVFADTILNRIYTNAGRAQRYGLEVATDLALTKGWKLYVGGTVYRSVISGQLNAARFFQNAVVFNNAAWVYSVNVNTSVQPAPSWVIQGNLNYLSQRITAQGEDSRFFQPNLSVRKSFRANRLAITMQWQNIGLGWLPTNEQRITTRGTSMPGTSIPGTSMPGRNFFTTTNYIQEKDILLVNISYSLRQRSKPAKLPTNEFGEKEF
ncbi:TonB-dependent receptor plug [Fibrisoma limi BUZ 3]|uniref:TonB-dependent receptor plug n=1 Tax=Fibrisoma limi BUZ 3 TaxID=1185876 RepID=I2GN70_9BACT|nr:outer membrane beta-barrel family protein [Fibrisoma limi]CCH55348.1 TonB-dependent receptor plug [Fibrisoma limi BUZ 3]